MSTTNSIELTRILNIMNTLGVPTESQNGDELFAFERMNAVAENMSFMRTNIEVQGILLDLVKAKFNISEDDFSKMVEEANNIFVKNSEAQHKANNPDPIKLPDAPAEEQLELDLEPINQDAPGEPG